MAIPSKSFQMVIYPVAQQKGFMKEGGSIQRIIYVAPTTSIQAMLGGDVQITGAGSAHGQHRPRQYTLKSRGRHQR